MIELSIAVLMLAIITGIYYISQKLITFSPYATILKAGTTVLLIFASALISYTCNSALGFFITVGMVFGLLGDIWLDLKYVYYEKDEKIYTYSGFTAFGIMHLIIIAGLIFIYHISFINVLLFAMIGIVAGILNVLIGERYLGQDFGMYRFTTVVYGAILFAALIFVAYSCVWCSVPFIMLFAYIIFMLSDLFLSAIYFGDDASDRTLIANLGAYYLSMFLLATVGGY